MAYYTTIKGKRYDKELLDLTESLVAGRGDGRISLKDAEKLLAKVKDANSYTAVEKSTMEYIRKNFKFTPEADAYFRTEIRKWAGTKTAAKKKTASKKKPAAKKKAVAKKKPASKKKKLK
ncbi:MAG: hypothetical protein SFU98_18240 [Leptospiraceae bacterium]|nr:hypothetical protein [Leptospiraceae bacterium]